MTQWLKDFVFIEPWTDLRGTAEPDRRRQQALTAELHRELADDHPLSAESWTVIAASGACDDILVTLDNTRAAIVHLTYVPKPPDRPPWPMTTTYSSPTDLEPALDFDP